MFMLYFGGQAHLLLPSQALRASSPEGRAKFTLVGKGKLCGNTKFLLLCLTTNFAKIDTGTLGFPRGGAVTGCVSAL